MRKSVRRKSVRRKSVRRNYVIKTRRRKSGRNKTTIKRNYKKNKNRNRRNRKVKTNNNYKFMKGGTRGWKQVQKGSDLSSFFQPVDGGFIVKKSESEEENQVHRLAILIPGELPRYADEIKIEYRMLKDQHAMGYTDGSGKYFQFYHVSIVINAKSLDNPTDVLELRFMKSNVNLDKFKFKDLKEIVLNHFEFAVDRTDDEKEYLVKNVVIQANSACDLITLNKKNVRVHSTKTTPDNWQNFKRVEGYIQRIIQDSMTGIEFKKKDPKAFFWSRGLKTKGWENLVRENMHAGTREERDTLDRRLHKMYVGHLSGRNLSKKVLYELFKKCTNVIFDPTDSGILKVKNVFVKSPDGFSTNYMYKLTECHIFGLSSWSTFPPKMFFENILGMCDKPLEARAPSSTDNGECDTITNWVEKALNEKATSNNNIVEWVDSIQNGGGPSPLLALAAVPLAGLAVFMKRWNANREKRQSAAQHCMDPPNGNERLGQLYRDNMNYLVNIDIIRWCKFRLIPSFDISHYTSILSYFQMVKIMRGASLTNSVTKTDQELITLFSKKRNLPLPEDKTYKDMFINYWVTSICDLYINKTDNSDDQFLNWLIGIILRLDSNLLNKESKGKLQVIEQHSRYVEGLEVRRDEHMKMNLIYNDFNELYNILNDFHPIQRGNFDDHMKAIYIVRRLILDVIIGKNPFIPVWLGVGICGIREGVGVVNHKTLKTPPNRKWLQLLMNMDPLWVDKKFVYNTSDLLAGTPPAPIEITKKIYSGEIAGEGSFGTVHIVKEPFMNMHVVIKVMHKLHENPSTDPKVPIKDDNRQVTKITQAVKELFNEARLSQHLVSMYDIPTFHIGDRVSVQNDTGKWVWGVIVAMESKVEDQLGVMLLYERGVRTPKKIPRSRVRAFGRHMHPNLMVPIYLIADDGGWPRLVSELATKNSVDKELYIDNWKPTNEEIIQCALDLAEGLDHLHTGCQDFLANHPESCVTCDERRRVDSVNSTCYKIIHRDIKSANVLIADDGYSRFAVTDIGLSRWMELHPGRNQGSCDAGIMTGCGSSLWMAPELLRKDYDQSIIYDETVDIYAYGMTILELIDCHLPFSYIQPGTASEKVINGGALVAFNLYFPVILPNGDPDIVRLAILEVLKGCCKGRAAKWKDNSREWEAVDNGDRTPSFKTIIVQLNKILNENNIVLPSDPNYSKHVLSDEAEQAKKTELIEAITIAHDNGAKFNQDYGLNIEELKAVAKQVGADKFIMAYKQEGDVYDPHRDDTRRVKAMIPPVNTMDNNIGILCMSLYRQVFTPVEVIRSGNGGLNTLITNILVEAGRARLGGGAPIAHGAPQNI